MEECKKWQGKQNKTKKYKFNLAVLRAHRKKKKNVNSEESNFLNILLEIDGEQQQEKKKKKKIKTTQEPESICILFMKPQV